MGQGNLSPRRWEQIAGTSVESRLILIVVYAMLCDTLRGRFPLGAMVLRCVTHFGVTCGSALGDPEVGHTP